LLTALLLVPTLAGAIIAVGASLAVQTLNETGFRVCLALTLYGVAPTITLTAVLVRPVPSAGGCFWPGWHLEPGCSSRPASPLRRWWAEPPNNPGDSSPVYDV